MSSEPSTEAVGETAQALVGDASSDRPAPKLLGSAPTPGPIATDGVSLFIGSGNNVLSMPIAGGLATPLYPAATPCCATGLTASAGNVFWIDPNGDPDATAIFAGHSTRGTPQKVYSGFATGQPIVDGVAITTDGRRLYVTDEVNGNVVSMNLDGSDIQTLVSRYDGFFSTEHWNGIAVANGTVYVADEGCDCSGGTEVPQIVSVPAGGGGFTTLFAFPDFSVRPHDIVVVGGVLYFTDSVSNTIWQMPTSGAMPVPFIAGSPFVRVSGITALGTTLYVTDSGAGSVYSIETGPASDCGASGGRTCFTIIGSLPAPTPDGKPDGEFASGSPQNTLLCNPQRAKEFRDEGLRAASFMSRIGAVDASGLLHHFLGGNGRSIDFPDGSTLSLAIKADPQFIALDRTVQAAAAADFNAGLATADVTSSLKKPDFSTSSTALSLELAFGGTQGLDVTGSVHIEGGSYTGTITYTIRDVYGFSSKDKFIHRGPMMHYLQGICGAPFFAKGAHWFYDSVKVTVPFSQPAP